MHKREGSGSAIRLLGSMLIESDEVLVRIVDHALVEYLKKDSAWRNERAELMDRRAARPTPARTGSAPAGRMATVPGCGPPSALYRRPKEGTVPRPLVTPRQTKVPIKVRVRGSRTEGEVFSFGTACTHHGLTEQVFAETYIVCRERRPSVIVRDTRYVFVAVARERFFGFAEVVVLGEAIQMATPERALADALDRPRYAGGLTEVSRMVSRAGGKISWDAMLNLLARWNESALVQRLGYLLDLHGVPVPPDRRTALIALLRPTSKVVFGPRTRWGTEGKLVRPWNVIANVPEQELLEKGQPARRRVSFGPPRSKPSQRISSRNLLESP